jgi:hypothetical protein
MRPTDEEHEEVRRSVERLFRDVADRFENAIVRDDVPGPGLLGLIELSCSTPGTARIAALPGADQIDLYVGSKTGLELRPSKHDPGQPLTRVISILESVVSGDFKEWVRLRRIRYLPYS